MERPGTDELGENAIRLGDVVATGIEPGVDADGLLGRLTGDLSDHGGVGAVSDGVLALPAQAVPGLKRGGGPGPKGRRRGFPSGGRLRIGFSHDVGNTVGRRPDDDVVRGPEQE